ncbi:hypothetical protein [Solibacillus sp. CAU 1738]|uniref:hypothetical protein n=1 Tax=Solibacillus sp. CAU 1738 TaxID=3140363 RepID=UPI003261D3DB
MKSYVKLVNFEINRFFKLYLILMGLTIVCQVFGAIIFSKGYMISANRIIYENQLSVSQYTEQYGTFSFDHFFSSGWIEIPIYFCIAMLTIYVFFIWYRDWFGKNTFIYRLLMLPTERINIYFAKLTTIMLLVLGLITMQILLILIDMQIVNSIVPADYRTYFSIFENNHLDLWLLLYPNTFIEFIMMYGFGLIFVAVLFTAILFERSYRLKGIFFAIVYGMLSFGVFITPFLLAGNTSYFYPLEIFLMVIGASILVLGSAIWIANHLLKHKIRV